MANQDVPRDIHPALDPAQDATQRGTNPAGGEDEHPAHLHSDPPPVDPNYRPTKTSQRLDRLLRETGPRHRTETLFPFLYVRAVPGDLGGGRPLWEPIPCWESCDIHLLPVAEPTFDFSRTVLRPVAGQTYRIFVHVWNLGRFAAYGARLRAWWVEPGFFNGSADPRYQPHYIGGAYFDLGDRDSGQAHNLIEVRPAWTVQMNQPAHECLIVAVECATDPWDGAMEANTHRHVAQRNLDLVAGNTNLTPIVRVLAGKFEGARQLLIGHASVRATALVGSVERGLSSTRENPRGWNHTPLELGAELHPIAAIRSSGEGSEFFNLRDQPVAPDPGAPLAGGMPLGEPFERSLSTLLAEAVGVRKLTGRNVAAALGAGPSEARVLRFVLTDAAGATGGYSVVVAP